MSKQIEALTAERDAAISQIGDIARAKVEVEAERDQLQRLLEIATTALAAKSDESLEAACNQLEAERDALKAALLELVKCADEDALPFEWERALNDARRLLGLEG